MVSRFQVFLSKEWKLPAAMAGDVFFLLTPMLPLGPTMHFSAIPRICLNLVFLLLKLRILRLTYAPCRDSHLPGMMQDRPPIWHQGCFFHRSCCHSSPLQCFCRLSMIGSFIG